MKQLTQKCTYALSLILFGILALVPFHALFTTWIGSNTGGLLLIRAWKEALMVLAFVLVIVILFKDAKFRKNLFHDKLVQAIMLFAGWQLLVSVFLSRDVDSLALGLAIQLRLFAIFIVARVVAYYRPPSRAFIEKLLLIPFLGVVVFGVLQMFILPYDFLKHFGYDKNLTIPPYFTIDSQIDNLRIASTLRGPNPLGVYLILPLLMIVDFVVARKNTIAYILLAVAGFIVMYGSHSRGSWIAMCAAILVWILFTVPKKWLPVLVIAGALAGITAGSSVYVYRNTSFVQNVFLHDNPGVGPEENSNQGHSTAIENGIKDVAQRPVGGCGAGCAGPASVHNENGVKISENYFLQTAQESGLIGLGLLLVLFGIVIVRLYAMRSDKFAVILLASFVGINVASLFAHSWADDTIAYLWWGVAGLFIGTYNHLGSETANAKRLRTSAAKSSRLSS